MNNSKQTVLSIVGIAILVIAVVGVSFAFFTYSRQGTTNNVITTGSISFDSNIDSVNALSLTNKFPQTDEEGATNDAYQFNVTGTIPTSANPVYYGIYVVDTNILESTYVPENHTSTNKFQPSEISIKVTPPASGATVVGSYGTTGAALTTAVNSTPGLLVAYGTVPADNTATTHGFKLTMWVNDTVKISDTSGTADGYQYRAHAYDATNWPEKPAGVENDTRKVYSDMWYSIRVRLDANDTTPYGA